MAMNTDVDNYFVNGCGRCDKAGTPSCKVNNWTDLLRHLREILQSSELTEDCKWGVPVYTYQGKNVLILSAFNEACRIGFFKGVLLEDSERVLEAAGKNSNESRELRFDENEGDLIIAADKVTPEIINFMATEACGLICMPITPERARRLRIPLMVRDNRSQHETNFTVSIDASEQIAPGVSARQRAHTVQKAVAADAEPSDIRQPGHIFPLVAKPGGVLRRAGHTEAGVDLARMAGCEPAAVIVEIMNDDGTMARRPELEVFAEQHGLKMGTIADLIEYRSLHEHSIAVGESHEVATEWGPFTLHSFRDTIDDTLHFALQRGSLEDGQAVPVRVQSIDLLRDIFGTQLGEGRTGWSYRSAMAYIAERNQGVVVLVGQSTSSEQVLTDVHQFLSSGAPPPPPQNYRLIGTGAQILRHLGIQRMALLSAPLRFNALSGFNLEVTEFLAPDA